MSKRQHRPAHIQASIPPPKPKLTAAGYTAQLVEQMHDPPATPVKLDEAKVWIAGMQSTIFRTERAQVQERRAAEKG